MLLRVTTFGLLLSFLTVPALAQEIKRGSVNRLKDPSTLPKFNAEKCEEAIQRLLGFGDRVMLTESDLVIHSATDKTTKVWPLTPGKRWDVSSTKCSSADSKPGESAITQIQALIRAQEKSVLIPEGTGGIKGPNRDRQAAIDTCGERFKFDFSK